MTMMESKVKSDRLGQDSMKVLRCQKLRQACMKVLRDQRDKAKTA